MSYLSMFVCSFRSVCTNFIFQRFVENHNVTTVFNELLMLDHGEVTSQCKLK